MPDGHLRDETPEEYFKDLVGAALFRQHLQVTELTGYYLVNLLCRFVRPSSRIPYSDESAEPLALRLRRALESGGVEQRERLRNLGDFSLFTSGFFGDSLQRRVIDIDYYVSMGEYAYGSLGRRDEDALGEVFAELARKFVGFVDVLSDVSDHTSLASNADLLRIYERWVRTGSRKESQRLLERGILPAPGTRRIQ
ncbi:MAG TPA: hypothetical protein VL484_06875 [Vicinamibacterales bacterium]|nr:hypothetical protein [Vicinamibacterales bacterium]